MIINMEKLAVYCLSEDKEKILSGLMRIKCVQLVDAGSLLGQEGIGAAAKRPADVFSLEQEFSRVGSTLKSLSYYREKDSLFTKRRQVGFEDYKDQQEIARGRESWQAAEQTLEALDQCRADLTKLRFQDAAVKPWKDLDLPVELTATRDCRIKHLILVKNQLIQEAEEELESLGGQLFPISEDEEYKYTLLICHKGDEGNVEEAVKLAGMLKPDFEGLEGLPSQLSRTIHIEIEKTEEKIEKLEQELKILAADTEPVKLLHDSLSVQLSCRKAEENLVHTESVSVLTGWVPVTKKEKVEKYLEKFQCYYTMTEPQEDEERPILLKNNKLIEPFEAVTDMYSLPQPFEVDPNPLMAPFFFVFFGMMLSDAAYGLLLILGGAFMLKKMDLAESTKKLVKLMMMGGVATVICGFIYGGFFGDIISVVLGTFFDIEFTMPALIIPMDEPIKLLIISCGLGIIHLFTGMGIQAYMLIKRGKWKDALFDIGFWYVTIIGILLIFLEATRTAGFIATGAGILGLLLTQGREKPTLAGKVIGGLGSLYDITGYLSDVLSYARLLALGLATGVIAEVINMLGTLPGKSIVSVLLLIVVFPFGHALNMAINTLGTYVHSSRLQYVEFFGKFYEGGGKPFRPFRPETTYTLAVEKDSE